MSQQATLVQPASTPDLVALLGQLSDAERAELSTSPVVEALRVQLTLTEVLMQQSRTAEKLAQVRSAVDRLWAGMPMRLKHKTI